MKFRNLRADEIDVRVAQVKTNGCMLLLYKDARCDMRILDESGVQWQRKHYECKGNLFCSVGIKIDDEWIWKDDCGAESYSDKEKGEASDSFKRACFNWGIGRELYTAPFIWVDAKNVNISGNKTNDRFKVDFINIENGVITGLKIYNKSKKCVAFVMGKNNAPTPPKPQKPKLTPQQYVAAKKKEKNVSDEEFFGYIKEIIGKNNLADCTKEDCTEIYKWLETQ